MDFSSSGQGVVEVTAIYADGVTLANAIELIDVEEDPVQFEVCDHCGYPGCAAGGWLSIKKLGELIFFIPAFRKMEEGAWEDSEYDAPYFTRVKGSILLDQRKYQKLLALAEKLPVTEDIVQLTSDELARLIQWEAPFGVLGARLSSVRFRRELLITTSFSDDVEALNALLTVLESFLSGRFTPELGVRAGGDEEISFFLEAADFVEWRPLIRLSDGRYGLSLSNGYFAVKA